MNIGIVNQAFIFGGGLGEGSDFLYLCDLVECVFLGVFFRATNCGIGLGVFLLIYPGCQ